MTVLKIVVPIPDSELRKEIWTASGIVASEEGQTGRLRLDYEGDDDLYSTYADRVRRAANRHQWARGHRSGYPTRASAFVDPNEVLTVGTVDPNSWELTITDADVLANWLDVDEIPETELELSRDA
mgnify:CR=1 FL=1